MISTAAKTSDADQPYPAPDHFMGYGLGLRKDHYQAILDEQPDVDWFEILTENYMVGGGKPLHFLDRIRADYPVVMHGVSLSIGSTDPLNLQYLKNLKDLAARVQPGWISDHLCWTGYAGHNLHDLLPMPYTEEAINHVVDRICRVQDYLGRQILIENVSTYLTYSSDMMPEWDFLSEIASRADCHILLDINNIYVSSVNHGFDPLDYLKGVPGHRVRQFHLAGHADYGDYVIDTHDHDVADPVWALFEKALTLVGPVSTMIERDDRIPPLEDMLKELDKARQIGARIFE